MNAHHELVAKYIGGTISSDEMAQLRELYNIEDIDATLADLSQLSIETALAEKEWDRFQTLQGAETTASRSGMRSRVWYLLLFGLLAMVAATLWYLDSDDLVEHHNDTTTPQLIALDDGSSVRLGPGSSIAYDDDFVDDRSITLDGHAYFEVESGSPFVVTTDGVEVVVLGTSFDVWDLGRDRARVDCYSGSVSVRSDDRSVTLLRGQRAVLADGQLVDQSIGQEDRPTWLRGSLSWKKYHYRSYMRR